MALLTSTFNCIFMLAQKMTLHTLHRPQSTSHFIFLSPIIPPDEMVYPKSPTTPNHGYINTYIIYKFLCLTDINMKYVLHTSCTGCLQIYNDIQQVHTGYKREGHSFYITKLWINLKRRNICAYIF